MRDQDEAHLALGLQIGEQLHHLGLHGDVESGRGLVRDDDLRVQSQRYSDHDALPHAAGELVREVVDPLPGGWDVDSVHQLDGPILGVGPGRATMHPEHLADLESDAVDGVQRGQRVLEDHCDLLPAV